MMITNAIYKHLPRLNLRRITMAVLAFATVACTTQKKISFQALTPAEITLPPHLGRLCILDHTIRPATDSNGVYYGFGGALYYDSSSYDTLLSYHLLEGLKTGLDISGRLVADEPVFLSRNQPGRTSPVQSFEILNQVCGRESADAALVAETISAFDNLDYFAFNDGLFIVRLTLTSSASFRLYDLQEQRIIDRVTLTDTIMYENLAFGWEKALRPIPPRDGAYADIAWRLGQIYASRISPGLANHNRLYFVTGNHDMTSGHEYAQQGLWATAARHWIIPAQGKNKRQAALACFNMALASEMEGKPDIALYWINKCLEIKKIPQALIYKSQLEARLAELEKLTGQMNYKP